MKSVRDRRVVVLSSIADIRPVTGSLGSQLGSQDRLVHLTVNSLIPNIFSDHAITN